MNIVDRLDARVARDKTSDRALARTAGTTVPILDRDTTAPDPVREGYVATEVTNLATGEVQTFSLPPDKAVVVAYEQSLKRWCTWQYPAPTEHPRFREGMDYVSCGDFTAKKE